MLGMGAKERKLSQGAVLLSRWMERVDLTQPQAAFLLGVTQQTVSRWVLGVRRPQTHDVVERVRTVAGIAPSEWSRAAKGGR